MACAPENTMASFREGLRCGADVIEVDVQLSADGYVVAFHDECLERTTSGSGPMAQHTLAQLKSLDAGEWFHPRFAGERIPALEEVLAWAKERVPLFIELKYNQHTLPGLAAAVVDLVVAAELRDRVMIIAFNHEALASIKNRMPGLATGALYATPVKDPVRLARSLDANAVMPLWRTITAGDVVACHAAGLSVNAWGDGIDYAALIALGVDCVNADDPAWVQRRFFEGRDIVRCKSLAKSCSTRVVGEHASEQG
jgi:glycerophosphoryl diester phosphodiesterase